MEVTVRVDDKGRILIPKEIREKLGIKSIVKIKVEGDKLVITPIRDPLHILTASVVKGTRDVASEIKSLRGAAEEEALKGLDERWS